MSASNKMNHRKILFIIIAISAISLYLIFINKNFTGVYGTVSEDGNYYYIQLKEDMIITNIKKDKNGKDIRGTYTIEDHIDIRLNNKLFSQRDSYANIIANDWNAGVYGKIVGRIYDDENGITHISIPDYDFYYGIHSAEEYYYLLGEKEASSYRKNELKAIDYYRRAGINDSEEKIKKLCNSVFDKLKDTSLESYKDGSAFLKLKEIYHYIDDPEINQCISIAYSNWLQSISIPCYWMEKEQGGIEQYNNPVYFGHYEQDNNIQNGKEEIKWDYINFLSDPNKIMLVAKSSLDYRPYHYSKNFRTWEESDLFEWLNFDFMEEAFTPAEKNLIECITILSLKEINEIEGNYISISNEITPDADGRYIVRDEFGISTSQYVDAVAGRIRDIFITPTFWVKSEKPNAPVVSYGIQYQKNDVNPTEMHDVVPAIILKKEWENP